MLKHQSIDTAKALRDEVILPAVQNLRDLCHEHGFACIIVAAAQVAYEGCAVSEVKGDIPTLAICYTIFKDEPMYRTIANEAMGVSVR